MDLSFYGKKICFTGKLQSFKNRNQALQAVTDRGGFPKKKISNICDFLVVGNSGDDRWVTPAAGTKIIHARKVGIPIISENEFNFALDEFPVIPESDRPKESYVKIRVYRSENSSIVRTIIPNGFVNSNFNPHKHNNLDQKYIIKLTYAVYGVFDVQTKMSSFLDRLNETLMSFSDSITDYNSELDARPGEIKLELSKIIRVEAGTIDLENWYQKLQNAITVNNSASYNKLWIRIYPETSAYYNRWNERFIESKENK